MVRRFIWEIQPRRTLRGKASWSWKMTSRKELTLNNVLFFLEIWKNLMSGSLLSKHDFRMIFEANRVILNKTGMYVRQVYMTDGLFKMNVIILIPTINEKKFLVFYILESFILWHCRLWHVNYDSMHFQLSTLIKITSARLVLKRS